MRTRGIGSEDVNPKTNCKARDDPVHFRRHPDARLAHVLLICHPTVGGNRILTIATIALRERCLSTREISS